MRMENAARFLGWVRGFSVFSNSLRSESGVVPLKQKTSGREKYEKLWRDLIADSSKWWDNRVGKPNVRCPDFKHKQTGQSVWLTDRRNPPWVASEIASIAPGVSMFSRAKMLSEFNMAGQCEKTLEHFERMRRDGSVIDGYVFVHVLNACASLKSLEQGRRIHRQILDSDCESNIFVSCSLIDMYAKCGSIDEAWRIFNKMPTRNVVAWSAIILGCVKCGEALKALQLFQRMQKIGVEPNSVTYVGLLHACTSLEALEEGRRVHQQIIRSSLESDRYVCSSLIDMYAKCGSIEESLGVFDKMPSRNVVVWTAMILGCVKCGDDFRALELFRQMQAKEIKPNSVTFVGLLNACASLAALEEGRRVHKQIIQGGYESDVYVGSSLIDMYAKCGDIVEAWNVFNNMPIADVVAWTAMILGFVKCGEGLKAIALFKQMQEKGLEPESRTFVGVLNACASIAALEEGRRAHRQIIHSGFESDIYVGNSLVDMYAKCGNIDMAWTVFNKMPTRNAVAWTVMIMGYAMHGLVKEAVALFEQMSQAGLKMDEITFICLLTACSHGGLLKEGIQYFGRMWSVYGISPTQEHYTCMVDILGRAGQLDHAEEMAKTMPFEPCAATWMSLLAACRVHGNVQIGERAARRVLELDPSHAAGYVLLSNIYAAFGYWDGRAILQKQRKDNHVKKQPGLSWIEINNEVHTFVVNDGQHPQILEIHTELTRLSEHMKAAGYIPDTRFALLDTAEDMMVDHLFRHSEKLAIAYGLISTPPGVPLRIAKNLRVCGDCHTAAKFISKIEWREITVRDANRFHHFKNGLCSCGDYW